MVLVIVLSVVVWLSIPPVLSRVMTRHGYDGTSHLVLGALFGPLAVVFAVMEVLFDVPEPARILEEGRTGQGGLSVLVIVGAEPTTFLPAKALALPFGRPDVAIPEHAASHGFPLSMAVIVDAPLITGSRLRSMTGLPPRLVDVGDAWRALLLGAPPILL